LVVTLILGRHLSIGERLVDSEVISSLVVLFFVFFPLVNFNGVYILGLIFGELAIGSVDELRDIGLGLDLFVLDGLVADRAFEIIEFALALDVALFELELAIF